MGKFYFTYGTGEQPFYGGWTEIEAPSQAAACTIFKMFHPDKTAGLLNCSSVYSAENYEKSNMFKNGNFDRFCHERIVLTREICKG